eukprot:m51a1_g12086 putative nodal modulator 1-like (138) ;mRNA; f:4816-5493
MAPTQLGLATLVAVLSLALRVTSSDDILGCGGFVRFSDPIQKVLGDGAADMSAVSVRIAKGGVAKMAMECAPNGYFFLPVDERGSYVVSVSSASGWSFEPEQVTVEVGGEHSQCTGSASLSFVVTGFPVTGRVRRER